MEAPRRGLLRALRRRPAVRAVHRPAPRAGRPPATRRPGHPLEPRLAGVRRGPLCLLRCRATSSAGAKEEEAAALRQAARAAAASAEAGNAPSCSARRAVASISTSVAHALRAPARASGPLPPSCRSPPAPFARGPIRSPACSHFAVFRAERRADRLDRASHRWEDKTTKRRDALKNST
jgi:hypothetical protein